MSLVTATKPLLLGRLAIYAFDMQVARQVHALVLACKQPHAFGTVALATGEEVDWVDMAYDTSDGTPAR